MNGTTKFTPSAQVMTRRINDEIVLLDLSSDGYFSLNPIGAFVFDTISQNQDLDATIAAVVSEFDVGDAEARSDVVALLTALMDAGLVAVTA